ncbi:MAG: hypothetical protein DI590_00490 [Methylorubrum populi]|nr:hypothetical protein [Methylobacterium sp. DB1607]PZP72975.1 MAG: hypothetical protein DI590_00490 [Methylorubrum populi]
MAPFPVVAALADDLMMLLVMVRLTMMAVRLPVLDDVSMALRAVSVAVGGPDFVERPRRPCRGPECGRGGHEQPDLQQFRHPFTSIVVLRLKERAWPHIRSVGIQAFLLSRRAFRARWRGRPTAGGLGRGVGKWQVGPCNHLRVSYGLVLAGTASVRGGGTGPAAPVVEPLPARGSGSP